MVDSRAELKRYWREERKLYIPACSKLHEWRCRFSKEFPYLVWDYVRLLRKCEYHKNCNGIIHKIALVFCRRRKNKLGLLLEIDIKENCFEEGLHIYHGNIVVNTESRIGKGCKLHGMNCIGNKGTSLGAPKLGDNIRIGFGGGIFGEISIPNDCIVAANATVVKSPIEPGSVLVGVPAKALYILQR